MDFRFEPNVGFKLKFDLLVIILSIYCAFVTPMQFAMESMTSKEAPMKQIDIVVDIIFAFDILIMFRTNYRDIKTDIVINDSKLIALNYIKGRFLIDLMASFPFENAA